MGMGAGAEGNEKKSSDETAEIFRRRLKVPLLAVHNALGKKDTRNDTKSGLLSLTNSADDESFFAFVIVEINKLYSLLDDEESLYTELKPKVVKAYNEFAKKLKDPDKAFKEYQQALADKAAKASKK